MSNRSQPVVMEKPVDLSVIEKEGLPEEVRLEVSKGNFVRAAHLAIQKGVSRDKTRKRSAMPSAISLRSCKTSRAQRNLSEPAI